MSGSSGNAGLARRRARTLLFSLLPLCLLYLVSETLLSTFGFEPFVPLPIVTAPVPGRKVSPWGDERDVIERVCFGQPTLFEMPNLRAFLPPVPKPDGVRRVAFLGDSFVFGMGLPDDQTLPFLLGGWLHARRPDDPVEVVNFGFPGGNTTHYRQLAPQVAGYGPDRLLLGFTVSNDGETDASSKEAPPVGGPPGTGRTEAPRPRPADALERLRTVRDAILTHSRTLSLLYRPVRRFEARWRQDRFERATFDDPAKWETVEKNLAAIAALFRERDVPITLVIFPHMFPSRHVGLNDVGGYPYREYHARVRRVGEANGMEVFDVLDLVAERGITTLDAYIIDGDGHPNGRYTALVAGALGERLRADPRLARAAQRPAGAAPGTAAPADEPDGAARKRSK